MIKLISLEWLKAKNNTVYWILLGVYALAVYVVCSSGTILMNMTMEFTSNQELPPDIPQITIYDFPNIWHNLSYIASIVRAFLAISLIVNVSNEITNKTLRQNIIDGLSKEEFLLSKILYTLGLSIFAALVLVAISLKFGFEYSIDTSTEAILSNLDFVGAYFLEILTYLAFALCVSFSLRKASLSIVFVLGYSILFEPFFGWVIFDSESFIKKLLPINAMDNLIQSPINLMDPDNVQSSIATGDILIVLGWIIIFYAFSYLMIKKRDW